MLTSRNSSLRRFNHHYSNVLWWTQTCVDEHIPSARSLTATLESPLIGPSLVRRCFRFAGSGARTRCTQLLRLECAHEARESWYSWVRCVDAARYQSKTCETLDPRQDFQLLLVRMLLRGSRRACCTCRNLEWLYWLSVAALGGLFPVLSAISTAAAHWLGWYHLFLRDESPLHPHQIPSSFSSR